MSQQNKTTLQSSINTQISDNTSGDISAADVRNNLINITDSLVFNSGSQGITGSLTATSFTGSLQGTATTASYVLNAVSASHAITASYAATAQTASYVNGVNVDGYVNNAYTANVALNANTATVATQVSSIPVISSWVRIGLLPTAGDYQNQNLGYDPDSNLRFNAGTNQLFVPNISSSVSITGSSILATDGFTGSLLGTSTTASYVVTAQTASYVLNAVSASRAITASYAATASILLGSVTSASYATTASYATVAQTLLGGVVSSSYATTASYSTVAQTLLGNVTSASYAATSSISNTTIGAGDPATYPAGGEIQFKGSTGPGSAEGKNTYSSAFLWSNFGPGLTIGDPNTSYGSGAYFLATGYDSIANGNYSVSHGSSSYANGEGSFTNGKAVIALGNYSHAEGLGTISSGSYQHVQGQYNTQGDSTSLMIVGNGTSNGARKDAFKVRLSGSIVLPTTQSTAPSWTGTDGEMIFATVTGNHRFYVWMAGAWRSGSLS